MECFGAPPWRISPLGKGLLFLLFFWPLPVNGQMGGECDVPNHNGFVTLSLSNGSRITYFSSPTIVCPGNTRISADSAVVYEATNFTQLFRRVVFQDGENRLTSDQAQYFDQERRLRAWGRVTLNDLTEGSVIRGDTMILLRAGPGREEDRLTVLGRRPHATLYPTRRPVEVDTLSGGEEEGVPALPGDSTETVRADSAVADSTEAVRADSAVAASPDTAAAPADTLPVAAPELTPSPAPPPGPTQERTPYEIRAGRMFLEGSRFFRAIGSVTVDRDSLNATADSLEYDEDLGSLFLAREARLTTSAYELSGATIRLEIPQDEVRSVTAREEALLEGEDLWLLAPTISLFLQGGKVQRLVAVQAPAEDSISGPAEGAGRIPPPEVRVLGLSEFPLRPHAFSQDFLLWADSVEVLVPDEVLEEVWAMGRARGESLARDSLNTPETPPLVRRDWLEGDTIVAIFVPNEDSAGVAWEEMGEPEAVRPQRPAEVDAPVEETETAPDSAAYRLDRLVARVGARSLYRLAPSDTTTAGEDDRLAIHYVVGEEITIYMRESEVDRMEVAGQTQGIHLEPVSERRRVLPPDTTGGLVSGRTQGGRR
jgi:lipopolysaccharide export system protein LptA